MIIDAHCHIWDKKLISDDLRDMLNIYARQLNIDPSLIIDVSVDQLIKDMDESGIDKAVLLSLDYDLILKGNLNYKQYNDYVANIVKEYPDRFIGFMGIDLRREKAIEEVERCVNKLGFRGVKLWPVTGFFPNDSKFYPFYERVEEMELPILCHTGVSPPRTYLEYNRPVYIDKVAVDFPKLKIIMAHMGDPWYPEAIATTAKNPNVYMDISMWQCEFKWLPAFLYQTLFMAKQACGAHKILFGSDWPIYTTFASLKEWVNVIKKMKIPFALKLMGISKFTDAEKKQILGENAKKILGL